MTWTYSAELECGHELSGSAAEEVYGTGPGTAVDCPQHGETTVVRCGRKNW